MTDLERRALDRIEAITRFYGGVKEVRYAARDAMIWLSSQKEIQGRGYRKSSREEECDES